MRLFILGELIVDSEEPPAAFCIDAGLYYGKGEEACGLYMFNYCEDW